MDAGATADEAYVARWGYRRFDARRYERRRYGGVLGRMNHRMLERALARGLAGVAAGGLVLDVPCGTGVLARFLGRRGLRVVGADISPAMLAVARERGPLVGAVRLDLERSPVRPGSVDAVVCTRFLMHLPAAVRGRVLGTLARLARGPVVATVCHPYTTKSLTRAFRRAIGWQVKTSPRLTRAALAAELAASGLVLEAVIPVLPVFSEVWVIVVHATPGAA